MLILLLLLLLLLLPFNYLQAYECQNGLREDNTNYIYCARQSLQVIPQFQMNSSAIVVYDELVLSENQIQVINSIDIKVKKLYLDKNPIEFVSEQAFQSVQSYLEELYLDYPLVNKASFNDDHHSNHLHNNNLSIFTTNVFMQCINVKVLSIKNYYKSYLNANLFQKLTKLTHLTLQNAQVTSISDEAFNGLEVSLVELNLDSNELDAIPIQALKSLINLKKLSLSQNRIKHLAFDLRLNTLTSLNLAFNLIKSMELTHMNDIRELNLQNNELKFKHFLSILSDLTSLEELNIDFNKLAIVDHRQIALEFQSRLKLLSLQGNQLSQEHVSTLDTIEFSCLEKLNLARNKLESLYQIGSKTPALKYLLLDKNPLRHYSFKQLENTLVELSMSNVGLEEIDLRQMKALKKLKLSGNSIKHIQVAHTLISIDLQNNNLNSIPISLCDKSSTVREIDLSFNKIQVIREECLRSSLKTINLNNNPLKCNCENRYLREFLSKNVQQDLLEFIKWECAEPINVKQRLFTNFDSRQCIPISTTRVSAPSTMTILKTLLLQRVKLNSKNENNLSLVQSVTQKNSLNSSNINLYYATLSLILGCTMISILLIIIIYSLSIRNLKVKHAISKMTMLSTSESSCMSYSDHTTLSNQSTQHYYHDFNSWHKSKVNLKQVENYNPCFISHLYDDLAMNTINNNNLIFLVNKETLASTPEATSQQVPLGSLFI